jgi:hypothetical protein
MEIQKCRRDNIYDVGFVDPRRISEAMIMHNPEETYLNLYKYIKKQNYCDSILIPYNIE